VYDGSHVADQLTPNKVRETHRLLCSSTEEQSRSLALTRFLQVAQAWMMTGNAERAASRHHASDR
ncbi:hypothetical protein, partial [Bradyrhizobium sp. CCBAU 21362]|uniref:hypothetical protein n=1 Tax=Bradyrhizobium sp. CCBAU 21362 TaxID=1325082 RepID=UPI002305FDC5